MACSTKTSEETWNQHSVYIFVSYLQVLAASRSRLLPGSLTCHTTGKSSWRYPLSFNAANSSKRKAVYSHMHVHPHIVFLASPRWAVSLHVRRQYRPRRSSVIAMVQPTMVMQPNSFPRAPRTLYDRDMWWAGCWDCYGKYSPVSQQVNQAKWQQRTKENANTHNGKMALVDSRAFPGSETAQKISLVISGESGKQAVFRWGPS